MSIFSIKSNKYITHTYSLFERINYIKRATVCDPALMYGADVSIEDAFEEMLLVQEAYSQTNGKCYYHYVLNPEEYLDKHILFRAGIDIAEFIAHYKGHYQVLMTLHMSKESAEDNHLHYIVNKIDLDTGHRLDIDLGALYELKNQINNILSVYGISSIRQICTEGI